MDAVTPASIPVLVSSGAVKLIGETSKVSWDESTSCISSIKFISLLNSILTNFLQVARDVTDSIDIFVGKYLTLIATGYIGLKFIHFKVFPDFP